MILKMNPNTNQTNTKYARNHHTPIFMQQIDGAFVTNFQSTKICPQVPGRNSRAFSPSSPHQPSKTLLYFGQLS